VLEIFVAVFFKYSIEGDNKLLISVKMFSATSLMWLLGFQEVKAPGSSRLLALLRR
jgi:hypothetical protein